MPKAKCSECSGTGLVVASRGNKWCACPVGREYVREINAARAEMRRGKLREASKPQRPNLH